LLRSDKTTSLWNSSRKWAHYPSPKWYTSEDGAVKLYWQGKPKGQKNLPRGNFIHHKSHMDYLETEYLSPRWALTYLGLHSTIPLPARSLNISTFLPWDINTVIGHAYFKYHVHTCVEKGTKKRYFWNSPSGIA
jgi:hypothetical protein